MYKFEKIVYYFNIKMNNIYYKSYYLLWSHKDQTRVDAERRKKPFTRMAF